MVCPPIRGDDPRALASGLSPVQADKPWYNYFIPSLSDHDQGPVVQSIVSLASSFRGQLDLCFTKYIDIFIEKNERSFALTSR